MNMPDFTQLILKSSTWFLAGIAVYYLLSLIKVHLILNSQFRAFNTSDGEKLFSKYFSRLIKSLFSTSHIHKNTLNYVFNYKEERFKIFEDGKVLPIKKRLRILESLTIFLKPFLFFALVFAILRLWISSQFLYDELKITLGEIQTLLNYLNNFYAVKVLSQYKYLIYLIFGLVTIFIPYIYNKESLRKKLQQNLKYLVICISIITNVTFFGALTGNDIVSRDKQLTKLQLEIESIHSNIYKEASIEIILSELKEELKEEEEAYNQEYERFKTEVGEKKNSVKDSDINKELSLKLLNKLKKIQTSIFEIESFNFYNNTRKKKQHYSEYKKYYSKNYTQNSTYKEYGEYMGIKEKWNKQKGKSILKQVEKITKANKRINYDKKIADCLSVIFDYGLNEITSGVFKELDISSQKVLKKITSIWSKETFKRGFINKTINFLNFISNTPKAETILQTKNGLYTFSEKEFNKFKKGNQAYINKEVNIARKEQNILDRKNAVERFDKKLNSIIDKIIDEFEGNYSLDIYNNYKREIISDYKKGLNLNEIPLKKLNEIIVSTSIVKNKMKKLIGTNKIANHPFPANKCPICLYNGVISTIK